MSGEGTIYRDDCFACGAHLPQVAALISQHHALQGQRESDGTKSVSETVHGCPPDGSGVTLCCGKTPFELPGYDRLTLDAGLVTCPAQETER